MEEPKFREIADCVILHYGTTLIKRYQELSWCPNWQSLLQCRYETIRQTIHSEMRKQPDINNHRIDRHKIAAAYTKAIIEIAPLEIRSDALSPSPGARLANEALAFLTSVRIVRQILVQRFKNESAWAEIIAESAIKFPPSNDGAYPEHIYKAFYNANQKGLNAFVLANLYFMIESYHLQSLGCGGVAPGITANT